jgi:orotidine-5'-phosphate decarboxylase
MDASVNSDFSATRPFLSFADRLREKITRTGTYLCVGIDPPLSGLSPFLEKERTQLGPRRYLEKFGSCMIEAARDKVPAVKPQSAYFEAYGPDGFAALEVVQRKARDAGLLTILDAKRGDISSTMTAYGRMAFETMHADALTITPFMGLDVLEPLWPWLRKDKGVYVVWISSNPSGALVQDAVAGPLLAALKQACAAQGVEGALGLVLGATKVDELSDELYQASSSLSLLMPGVGAQGGWITERIRGLKEQSGAVLIPQSRSLMTEALKASSWDGFQAALERSISAEARSLRVLSHRDRR